MYVCCKAWQPLHANVLPASININSSPPLRAHCARISATYPHNLSTLSFCVCLCIHIAANCFNTPTTTTRRRQRRRRRRCKSRPKENSICQKDYGPITRTTCGISGVRMVKANRESCMSTTTLSTCSDSEKGQTRASSAHTIPEGASYRNTCKKTRLAGQSSIVVHYSSRYVLNT